MDADKWQLAKHCQLGVGWCGCSSRVGGVAVAREAERKVVILPRSGSAT